MSRYSFYIDGFNVYYALNKNPYLKYKWLNYRKLAQSIIKHTDVIARIVYFTTFVSWKPDAVAQHKEYIAALRNERVEIVRGRFMRKNVRCHLCHRTYKTREEKQTDVNIAVQMICDGMNDLYDRAVIVSADTNLIPVIEAIHQNTPDKEVGVLFPIRRPNNSLQKAADFARTMRENLLLKCQFPDQIQVGSRTIIRPDSWK